MRILVFLLSFFLAFSASAQKRPDQQPQKEPQASDAIYTQENPPGVIKKITFYKARDYFGSKVLPGCLSAVLPALDPLSSYKGYFVPHCSTGDIYYIDGDGRRIQVKSSIGSTLIPGSGINIVGTTISATDPSTTNELQTLSIAGSNITLSNGGGTVAVPSSESTTTTDSPTIDFTQTGANITATVKPLSITPAMLTQTYLTSEVDGSTTNELQTLSITGSNITLSNGGGTVAVPSSESTTTTDSPTIDFTQTGANITATVKPSSITPAMLTQTYLTSEMDASVTNELQSIVLAGNILTLSNGGGSVVLPGGGSGESTTVTDSPTIDFTMTGTDITATVKPASITPAMLTQTYLTTEADGSTTNEGSLSVGAGTPTTSLINSNTSGSSSVTLTAGSGIGLAESGNNITITATSSALPAATSGNQVLVSTGVGTTYTPRSLSANAAANKVGVEVAIDATTVKVGYDYDVLPLVATYPNPAAQYYLPAFDILGAANMKITPLELRHLLDWSGVNNAEYLLSSGASPLITYETCVELDALNNNITCAFNSFVPEGRTIIIKARRNTSNTITLIPQSSSHVFSVDGSTGTVTTSYVLAVGECIRATRYGNIFIIDK